MTELGYHPHRLDEAVHAGQEIKFTVPVLDGDGDPQSLAGWVTTAQAVHPTTGVVLHAFTTAIVSDAIEVSATPAQTRAWTWDVFKARLRVDGTPPSGAPMPLALGWITFYPR